MKKLISIILMIIMVCGIGFAKTRNGSRYPDGYPRQYLAEMLKPYAEEFGESADMYEKRVDGWLFYLFVWDEYILIVCLNLQEEPENQVWFVYQEREKDKDEQFPPRE